MDKFWWCAAWGICFCLMQLSLAQIGECPPQSGEREWESGVPRTP